MSEYRDLTTTIQDQVIDGIKQAQDITVATISAAADTLAGFVPDLPEVPWADRLPNPKEAVTSTYGFVTAVLEANRNYALQVIDALQPLTKKSPANA